MAEKRKNICRGEGGIYWERTRNEKGYRSGFKSYLRGRKASQRRERTDQEKSGEGKITKGLSIRVQRSILSWGLPH